MPVLEVAKHLQIGVLVAAVGGFVGCHSSPAIVERRGSYAIAGQTLACPVRIFGAEYFKDGGSMSVRVRDAAGVEMMFVSHSPFIEGDNPSEVERKIEETWRFYIGGFPGMPDVKPMKRGGDDQLELRRLLNDCIADAQAGQFALVDPGDDQYSDRSPNADRHVVGFVGRLDQEIQRYRPANSRSGRRAN